MLMVFNDNERFIEKYGFSFCRTYAMLNNILKVIAIIPIKLFNLL